MVKERLSMRKIKKVLRLFYDLRLLKKNIARSEDLFWAKQIMNSGYTIHYVSGARVFHSHTASLGYIRTQPCHG
jgi:hypothetical protein